MPVAMLDDRGVLKISGEDARSFLQGMVTCDMDKIAPDHAGFGALLTPQGKILFDFFIYEQDGAFLLDCPRALAADLAKRLGFYKLRAKVTIANLSDEFCVAASWGDTVRGWVDPRLGALGAREIVPRQNSENGYDAHRIALGVPQGGLDFVYGDTFPHEADMDVLGGVDFHKGCYVGQEVVARMQHKTVVRKRVVPVVFAAPPLPLGADVKAGELVIGRMGSSVVGRGLALVRLDKVEDAKAAERDLTVDGRKIEVLALPFVSKAD